MQSNFVTIFTWHSYTIGRSNTQWRKYISNKHILSRRSNITQVFERSNVRQFESPSSNLHVENLMKIRNFSPTKNKPDTDLLLQNRQLQKLRMGLTLDQDY